MATPLLGNPNYPEPEVTATAAGDSPTIASYLKRAFMFLEDGDWTRADEYCEKVLDIDPENARAYLGKLMAQLRVSRQSLLQEESQPFNHLDPFKKVIRFGDEALKSALSGYITHIIDRNEQTAYETGCAYMAKDTLEGYQNALEEFQKIPNAKGVPELTAQCKQKITAILNETCYQNGRSLMLQNTLDGYQKALSEFQKIPDYRDSVTLASQCTKNVEHLQKKARQRQIIRMAVITACCIVIVFSILLTTVIIPHIKYNNAVTLMNAGKYDEAITAFEALDDYKDTQTKITDCEYGKAVDLIEAGMHGEAIAALEALGDYPAAITQLNMLRTKLSQREVISAGAYHTISLKENGLVTATGKNDLGQCDATGWSDIIAVSAGFYHIVGLRPDGTVVATGDNIVNQCDVSNWTDIVAVSAGAFHTVGLQKDGSVIATGQNQWGQCNIVDWTNILSVYAGNFHTVGLKTDGSVIATGNNMENQCDVIKWIDIVTVSAGAFHTVGLKSDGTVVAVGSNRCDQCNIAGWSDIVAISAGSNHTVGLKSDGTVVAVGDNSYGQCDVAGWSDIVAVSAGSNHTVGLKSDGTVVAVGDNSYGQCNVANWKNIKLPG